MCGKSVTHLVSENYTEMEEEEGDEILARFLVLSHGWLNVNVYMAEGLENLLEPLCSISHRKERKPQGTIVEHWAEFFRSSIWVTRNFSSAWSEKAKGGCEMVTENEEEEVSILI